MPYCHSGNTDRKPSGSTSYNCRGTSKLSKQKKGDNRHQSEESENEWVSEPDTEQPTSELETSFEKMVRICGLWNGYRVEIESAPR